MCGSRKKPKQPEAAPPPPGAPPGPARTAGGFSSAGRLETDISPLKVRRRGIDSLRIDLNVPGGGKGGKGAYVP